MIDVGLFDPLIRFILRVVGNSPIRLVIGTAVLAGMVSLDGDGSTTFIITVSALLPIYLRLGMSPVVLTAVACLANGVLNIVPWGGPTVRAATVLKVSPNELFIPMVPGMIAAMVTVVGAGVPAGPVGEEAAAGLRAHPGDRGRGACRSGRYRRRRWRDRRSVRLARTGIRLASGTDAATGLRRRTTPTWRPGWTPTGKPCGRN